MAEDQRTTSYELLRLEGRDEMRVVSLSWLEDGGLEVRERTDGQYTLLAFGTLAHECRVVLEPHSVRLLAEGARVSRAEELVNWLEALFSRGWFISDLMDFLDAWEVSYACSVADGSQVAFRACALA